MAGRIPDRDIAAIRERVRIEEVVGDYVQLRRAGADSLKGLCPFHNEKSPSFHVRPNHGHFHCFGCGEGGDVYAFVQKIEHVSFVEAVELLADRIGHTISYSGPATSVQRDRGSRSRLIAANAAAAEFYAATLESDEAAPARQYLTERNFDAEAARHFGCGFAPSGWDSLTKHLQRKGFEFKELEAAGLSRQGRRGPMDRFHRRLLWPIRTSAGEVIGFGARRLFDDDPMEAKYINTPETLLYKKSSVMFGIDLAKRDIAKGHQAVVVEGYTDVMAMHLAGVTTAVASCGTAFGDEHLAMLRRLMMDDNWFRGELIYVFDGDEAGQAAALKAFDGEQNRSPDSRLSRSPRTAWIRASCGLVRRQRITRSGGSPKPMFEFAIRTRDSRRNGSRRRCRGQESTRCAAAFPWSPGSGTLRCATSTRDSLAGWMGCGRCAQVHRPGPGARRTGAERRHVAEDAVRALSIQRPCRRPVLRPHPPNREPPVPTRAIQPCGRSARHSNRRCSTRRWPARCSTRSPSKASLTPGTPPCARPSTRPAGRRPVSPERSGSMRCASRPASELTAGLINELGVEAIQVDDEKLPRYIAGVLARLQEVWMGRQIAEVKSKLQRMSPIEQGDEYHALFGDLVAMEAYRRSLLEQASGDDLTA